MIISALTLKERMIKVEKRTEQYIENIGRTSIFVLKYKNNCTNVYIIAMWLFTQITTIEHTLTIMSEIIFHTLPLLVLF